MIYLISLLIFILVSMMLGVGLVFGKKLRGSCGGVSIIRDGQSLSCETCPNRFDHPDCKRKKQKTVE